MVLEGIPTGYEIRFLIDIGIAIGAGFAIGAERESRNKPAAISTHCLVIGGAMIFLHSCPLWWIQILLQESRRR
jgi:putative Mg2+ transporter-C (MgtC) family protein